MSRSRPVASGERPFRLGSFPPLMYNRALSPPSVPLMTTLAKRTANRRNAQQSTGPKTNAGKAVARLNAVAHGLRAASPVVPGEDPATWEEYRDAVVSDLAPVGVLETELADRVALLSWRLRRVSAFEAGVIARTSDKAARRVRGEDEEENLFPSFSKPLVYQPTLASVRNALLVEEAEFDEQTALARVLARLPTTADDQPFDAEDATLLLGALPASLPGAEGVDDRTLDAPMTLDPMADVTHPKLLTALGVPAEHHHTPEEWDGWTAGLVRRGAERIAAAVKWTGPKLLAQATENNTAELKITKAVVVERKRELAAVKRTTAVEEAEARRRALVPAAETVEVVMKYEGHLQRQLTQTLHELERRQALRSDCPPQPPAAMDVTLHAADGTVIPGMSAG